MRQIIKNVIRGFLNEGDYSGEYSDLADFIESNKLEQEFVNKYNENGDITLDNWDDFVRGQLGYDTEVIENLAGNTYRVLYDDDTDYIKVSKKKLGKLTYKIQKSTSKDIKKAIDYSGINSEYAPRFAVNVDGKIVGGSTYKISNKIYYFDIGIIEGYQGYGILKNLLNKIIDDAKYKGAAYLKSQLVNTDIKDYLSKVGFDIYKSSEQYYVSLSI